MKTLPYTVNRRIQWSCFLKSENITFVSWQHHAWIPGSDFVLRYRKRILRHNCFHSTVWLHPVDLCLLFPYFCNNNPKLRLMIHLWYIPNASFLKLQHILAHAFLDLSYLCFFVTPSRCNLLYFYSTHSFGYHVHQLYLLSPAFNRMPHKA